MRTRLTDIRGTSSRSRPRDCSGERTSSATGLRREGGRSALTRKPGDRPCASARALTKDQRTGCSVVVKTVFQSIHDTRTLPTDSAEEEIW